MISTVSSMDDRLDCHTKVKEEVRDCLYKLEVLKSKGPDEIPPRLLEELAEKMKRH